jgi:hypothetical protein
MALTDMGTSRMAGDKNDGNLICPLVTSGLKIEPTQAG